MALDAVEIGLIQGPAVDASFQAAGIIDRPAVVAVALGLAVPLARLDPGVAQGQQTRLRRRSVATSVSS
jgi:hypothetical protein